MIHRMFFLTSYESFSSPLVQLNAHHNRKDKNAKLAPGTHLFCRSQIAAFGFVSRQP